MKTFVLRLDFEVKAKTRDEAGEFANLIIEMANEAEPVDLEHFRWAIVENQEGLDDPDLEKDFARAIYQ